MTKEALNMALQALESHIVWFSRDTMIGKSMREKTDKAIAAIKEALEQLDPVQEPVAWQYVVQLLIAAGHVTQKKVDQACEIAKVQPAQREWVGLTDEDIALIDWESLVTKKDCVQTIEAKLKELNT